MKEGLESYFNDGVVDIDKQDVPVQEAQVQTEVEEVQPEVSPIENIEPAVDTVEEPQVAQEAIPEIVDVNPLESITEEPVSVTSSPAQELPEGVDKLVKFMSDFPGKGLKEYMKLNEDVDSFSETALLSKFYKETKPHLDNDDVDFLLNKNFKIDEEDMDELEVRERKIALKEELSKAKQYLGNQKDEYYNELKSGGSVDDALVKKNQLVQEQAFKQFQDKTDEALKGFEGFVFDLGEKRKPVRYRINDVEGMKDGSNDLGKVFDQYFDNNELSDPIGYQKAVFAASNADNIASLFFEQGYAQAIEESQKTSKNVDFTQAKGQPSSDSKLGAGQAREITQPQNSSTQGKVNLKWNKF